MTARRVTWKMTGTLTWDPEKEGCEDTPEAIAADFRDAVDEGFDFMSRGDVDDFEIIEVAEQHVHSWIADWDVAESARSKTVQRCYGCLGRRDTP